MSRLLLQITLLSLLAAGLSFAQKGGGTKGGDTMSPPVMEAPNRFDQISSLLKLNKDQRKLLRSCMDDAQKEAAPLREQILKSELEIGEAVAASKAQPEVEHAAQATAELETKMTAVEMKAFAKLYKSLEKDQQSGAGPVFLMMHGMFRGKNWMDAKP